LAVALAIPFAGCTVGPDFIRPDAPVADQWLESGGPSVQTDHQEYEDWWAVYHDPTLNRLIDTAYKQNLTLMAAGTRVLEESAIGVRVGSSIRRRSRLGRMSAIIRPSGRSHLKPAASTENYWRASLGTQIAWELDFWGKFRRGVSLRMHLSGVHRDIR
jgi:outer membrane protein TolC